MEDEINEFLKQCRLQSSCASAEHRFLLQVLKILMISFSHGLHGCLIETCKLRLKLYQRVSIPYLDAWLGFASVFGILFSHFPSVLFVVLLS